MEEDDIQIKFKAIVKIQHWYMDIFYEEDGDYPNYRKIGQKNRAIDRVLNTITQNKEKQKEIYNTIIHHTWDNRDKTFKTICDALRKLGYKIIFEEG